MASGNERLPALLKIASGICFLFTAWSAWSITSQSTLGNFAPIVWGVGTVAAFDLLFIGALALIFGSTAKASRSATYSVWVAGASLLAIAAGYSNLGSLPLQGGIGYPQGHILWLWIAIVGFGLGWLGTHWDRI